MSDAATFRDLAMHGKDVTLKSLSVVFDDVPAVHPTDLDVAAGEILALLGPSGCGKTTLLRAVAGFQAPTRGRVSIGGADVTDLAPERRPTVLIAPTLGLFSTLSVADNVGFGLEARGLARPERRSRAEALLGLVGLAGAADRRPEDLGGEDRFRVALARALAIEPAALLLDEPCAALDPDPRRRLGADLKAILRRTGTTLLLATTDRSRALALADRVAVMNAGRIEQVDGPDRLYSEPASPYVAACVGEVNLIAGTVAALGRARIEVETAIGRLRVTPRADFALGQSVEVMIRPARLRLDGENGDGDDWNRLRADLVGRTLDGPVVAYDFAVGATRLLVHRPNLGLRNLLLANLHAIGFHAEDALAFPASAETRGASR